MGGTWQGKRLGLTIRLAKKEDFAKGDCFSIEQWKALSELHGGPNSHLVQEALLHYSKILPDLLIKKQEEEVERLKGIKSLLFTEE